MDDAENYAVQPRLRHAIAHNYIPEQDGEPGVSDIS